MNFFSNIFNGMCYIFGSIMNAICLGLKEIGIVSVPIGIIFFAIFVTLLMLPITIGQIKFSLAKVKMAPKMQAIYDHYAAKKDLTSEEVKEQSEEIKAVYKEAGVSPHGKIFGIILQIILLMAMYQVAGNVTRFVPMFNGASEDAFLLFGRDVSDIPMTILKNGFDMVSILLLAVIFLTMFPFGAILQKNMQNLIRGGLLAVLWTFLAAKLPVGLCLYWGTKSLMGLITGKIILSVFKRKTGSIQIKTEMKAE